MKIARVFTVCAALLSTFLAAETVHPKGRAPSRDQPTQSTATNVSNPHELTPRPHRPVPSPANQKSPTHVHFGSSKAPIRVRRVRSKTLRLRPHRLAGSRRRRQLQHFGGKAGHVGRSFELADNHIDSQQIESVQPAEAFDEGAVHLEPIYRVTKNRNVFDSIVDIVRRIVEPPKSVGPLVGPFHFPGVGDKVYIRLLEPVRPDHLVVRLVSHLPATKIESSFGKSVPVPSEVLGHVEIPAVEHVTVPLAKEVLPGPYEPPEDAHFIPPDSSLASSNEQHRFSKPMTPQATRLVHVIGAPKEEQLFKAYKLGAKQEESGGSHKVLKHLKRTPLPSPFTDTRGKSVQNGTRYSHQDLPSPNFLGHVYQFRSATNETSKESFEPYNVGYHQAVQYPKNISDSSDAFQHGAPEAFSYPQFSSSSEGGFPSKDSAEEHAEDRPRYSIEFTSKKMRYLNMDGSVEPAVKEDTSEEFKPVQLGPVYTEVSGPVDRHWKPLGGVTVRVRKTAEASSNEKERETLPNRPANQDGGPPAVGDRRLIEEHSRNETTSTIGEEGQGSCCPRPDNGDTIIPSERQRRNQTKLDKKDAGPLANLGPLQVHRLQPIWRNTTSQRHV